MLNTAPAEAPAPIVDRRLRFRMRMYVGIFLVLVVVIGVRVLQGRVGLTPVMLGLGGGIAIGLLVGRMYRLSWDDETNTVIGRIDLLGAALLVLYLIFSLLRDRLIGSWTDRAETISAVALCVTAGGMLGRVIFMLRGVRRILGDL